MLRTSILGVTLIAGLVAGCFNQSRPAGAGPIYRHHFIGTAAALASTNGTQFEEVWNLPVSQQLREYLLPKLAKAPRGLWQTQLPRDAADQTNLVRPLIEDLIRAESYLEIRGAE